MFSCFSSETELKIKPFSDTMVLLEFEKLEFELEKLEFEHEKLEF